MDVWRTLPMPVYPHMMTSTPSPITSNPHVLAGGPVAFDNYFTPRRRRRLVYDNNFARAAWRFGDNDTRRWRGRRLLNDYRRSTRTMVSLFGDATGEGGGSKANRAEPQCGRGNRSAVLVKEWGGCGRRIHSVH